MSRPRPHTLQSSVTTIEADTDNRAPHSAPSPASRPTLAPTITIVPHNVHHHQCRGRCSLQLPRSFNQQRSVTTIEADESSNAHDCAPHSAPSPASRPTQRRPNDHDRAPDTAPLPISRLTKAPTTTIVPHTVHHPQRRGRHLLRQCSVTTNEAYARSNDHDCAPLRAPSPTSMPTLDPTPSIVRPTVLCDHHRG